MSDGDRGGDVDQVEAICWAIDPKYRCVDLAVEFERLKGARAAAAVSVEALAPRVIVGVGRRRIEAAAAIRDWSGGVTRLIQIGRDRGHLGRLDGLVTTAAFSTRPSPKVLQLDIVPSDKIRRLIAEPHADRSREIGISPASESGGAGGGRPWIGVFIGNPPGAERSKVALLANRLDGIAERSNADLVITGSPRTDPGIYDALQSSLRRPHRLYRWQAGDPRNPFDVMLSGTRRSVVTGDSITMISQLVAAGHRTLVFNWNQPEPASWRMFHGTMALGLGPRRKDMGRFCSRLYKARLAAPLDGHHTFDDVHPEPGIHDRMLRMVRDMVHRLERKRPGLLDK